MPDPDLASALATLRDPATIRTRSHGLLARALEGRSEHFIVDLSRLEESAEYVAGVIREAYPSLDIPYHARWRHFAAGGRDRWGTLAAELDGADADEIARIRFDLCVVSVLLDAGAGPDWRFLEPGTGDLVTRSEGLAVASLHAFQDGLFSGLPGEPLRVDAAGLACLAPETLAGAFQAGPVNPLEGLAGRVGLLRALSETLAQRPDLFGSEGRVGRLYDALVFGGDDASIDRDGRSADSAVTMGGSMAVMAGPNAAGAAPNTATAAPTVIAGLDPAIPTGTHQHPRAKSVPAAAILAAVLDAFGPIWPDRLTLGGQSLGDVWRHHAIEAPDQTSGLIPFHKLSQWLTYSLVEILEDAGLRVTGLDELTGLPEYRNGGLFLDLGVLTLRDPGLTTRRVPVSDEAIVEWRALTVALLDRIAEPIRELLGRSAAELPLARILEGGTWAAGRRIARERRPDGSPPLTVLSDGTVF